MLYLRSADMSEYKGSEGYAFLKGCKLSSELRMLRVITFKSKSSSLFVDVNTHGSMVGSLRSGLRDNASAGLDVPGICLGPMILKRDNTSSHRAHLPSSDFDFIYVRGELSVYNVKGVELSR